MSNAGVVNRKDDEKDLKCVSFVSLSCSPFLWPKPDCLTYRRRMK